MIHSFTVTFGAKYLTRMVTSVPPPKLSVVLKINILHQSKNYKYQNGHIRMDNPDTRNVTDKTQNEDKRNTKELT